MTPWDTPLPIVLTFLFVLGCTIGSFLNVCVYRIPRHDRLGDQLRGLWSPPSSCPQCGKRISARDNVPIFGWLLLKGRCRNCSLPISPRYPLVELFNGLLFVLLYWREVPAGYRAALEHSSLFAADLGPQIIDGFSPTLHLNLRFLYHVILVEALLVASLIDWDLKIIPDGSTVPAMIAGVVVGAVGYVHLIPVWFQSAQYEPIYSQTLPEFMNFSAPEGGVPAWVLSAPHAHGLAASLAGLLVGGGLVWGVRLIGALILRREAMGFGDVVLMALIGSYLGWQAAVMVFFLAPICALFSSILALVLRREREIPYGPYLSLAALLVLLFFRDIWSYWQPIFQTGPLVPLMFLVGAVLLAASLALTQLVKKLLGIPLYEDEEWVEEWTSADQLTYQACENRDARQGRWRIDQWPGESSGRGTLPADQWRRGASPDWNSVRRRLR